MDSNDVEQPNKVNCHRWQGWPDSPANFTNDELYLIFYDLRDEFTKHHQNWLHPKLISDEELVKEALDRCGYYPDSRKGRCHTCHSDQVEVWSKPSHSNPSCWRCIPIFVDDMTPAKGVETLHTETKGPNLFYWPRWLHSLTTNTPEELYNIRDDFSDELAKRQCRLLLLDFISNKELMDRINHRCYLAAF